MYSKKGFSLIEILLFITVFAIGIVGVMTLYTNTLGKTSDPIVRNRSIQVLQSVMEVIYSKKWDENTPEGGCDDITSDNCSASNSSIGPDSGENSISDYDDVDDFVDSGSAYKKSKQWLSENFNLNPGYKVTITVSYANISGNKIYENTSSKTNYKLITVELQDKSGENFKLIAVKANF